jgi:hypothetical protein
VTDHDWRHTIANWNPDDGVAIRLKEFLTQMADRSDAETVKDFVDKLDPRTISQATGLPAAVIRRVLLRVQAQFRETSWS